MTDKASKLLGKLRKDREPGHYDDLVKGFEIVAKQAEHAVKALEKNGTLSEAASIVRFVMNAQEDAHY